MRKRARTTTNKRTERFMDTSGSAPQVTLIASSSQSPDGRHAIIRGLTGPERGLSRRTLLRAAARLAPALALPACAPRRPPGTASRRATDIRIVEADHQFEDYSYRAPYQFGGRSVDRVTLLNVTCRVRTGAGIESWGFGSMTLGNAWAFPAASQEAGLGAMKELAG